MIKKNFHISFSGNEDLLDLIKTYDNELKEQFVKHSMIVESKKALALEYESQKDNASKVVANGRGYIADKIIQIAKQHRVPLKEDEALVEISSKLDMYKEIPIELYKAVAEILVFVYKIKNKAI